MPRSTPRLVAYVIAALSFLATASDAVAQANSCSQLDRQLRSLTNDRDFQNYQRNADNFRAGTDQLQRMESAFVRGGCQRILNAGQRLPRECLNLARQIQRTRGDVGTLQERTARGAAVADAREDVLRQIARFGCRSGGSNVTIRRENSRGGFLQQLFSNLGLSGGGRDDIVGEDYSYFGQSTLRTVCVRACDGYYWPVSFSTVGEYLSQDASTCQQQCPTADVELFYYRNPGEGPEDMINLAGNRYADTEYAFKYREAFDTACTCKAEVDLGTIQLTAAEDGAGPANATVTFADISFPLPRPDPRRESGEIVTADLIFVPLPRPRPNREGEQQPVPPVVVSAEVRTFQFGDKVVRLVGPDTPYVPSAEAGS